MFVVAIIIVIMVIIIIIINVLLLLLQSIFSALTNWKLSAHFVLSDVKCFLHSPDMLT